jgi:hypothetical protein
MTKKPPFVTAIFLLLFCPVFYVFKKDNVDDSRNNSRQYQHHEKHFKPPPDKP